MFDATISLRNDKHASSTPTRDEWLVCYGRKAPPKGLCREYIFHTQFPRFVARVVELSEDGSGKPIAGEGDVDTESGVTYNFKNRLLICEVAWLETPKAMAQARVSPGDYIVKAARAAEEISGELSDEE